MSGYINDLSKKQVSKMEELKSLITDIWREDFNSDVYLLRWLRARNFNVTESEKMLRENDHWRKEEDIDNILKSTPIEVIRKYYPGGYLPGTDKDGYPIFVFPLGHVDPRQLFQAATFRDLSMARVQRMEYAEKVLIPQAAKSSGNPIDGFTSILDLEKFGMRNLWRTAMKEFVEGTSVIEKNYPETMHRIIIINNPLIFTIAYNLVKPLMSLTTESKVCFLGYNYQEELLKLIDGDQLPVCYGGTMVDTNGFEDCREWICWGGDIPSSYYMKMDKADTADEVTVAQGSKLDIEYYVDQAGCLLQWEFKTEDHDIKFGVFRYAISPSEDSSNKSLVPLVPMELMRSQLTPVKGELELKEAGIYVLQFDNTYSWTRSKKVIYRVDVLKTYMEGDTLL